MSKPVISQVKDIPLEKLTPHPKNDQIFKIESESYFTDLMSAMKKEGQIVPILVDKNYKILAGHNRYKVAKHLKWKTIKATVITSPIKSEAEELKLMLSEQINRRQFGPADRIKVYQMAFPNLEERALVVRHGAIPEGTESYGVTAREISEKTGVPLTTVNQDLVKFRKDVRELRGLDKKKAVPNSGLLNPAAIRSVRHSCTSIMRAVMHENKKTKTAASELLREVISEISGKTIS